MKLHQSFRSKLTGLFFLMLLYIEVQAQEVYQPVGDHSVYCFLDELAGSKVIALQSVVKPYSRRYIAGKLLEAESKKGLLSKRQKKELNFYLSDYGKEIAYEDFRNKCPDFLFYRDSSFTLSVSPVLGYSFDATPAVNNKVSNGVSGMQAFSYTGTDLGFYFMYTQTYGNTSPDIPGGWLLPGATAGHEVCGGVTYSKSWGSLGLVKDHFEWGDNETSASVFSGRPASFPRLDLHLAPVRWIDFHYIHASLSPEETDSSLISVVNPGNRLPFIPKFLAANLVTVTLIPGLDLSGGNAVVYNDRRIRQSYLVPFFFFRRGDKPVLSGSNMQKENGHVFLNISSRNLSNVHLYTSFFAGDIFPLNPPDYLSEKFGIHTSNLFLHDLFLMAEYTHSGSLVLQPDQTVVPFTSGGSNLGYDLGDGAEEIYFSAGYKPAANMIAEISCTQIKRNKNSSAFPRTDFFPAEVLHGNALTFKLNYQVLNRCSVKAGAMLSDLCSGNAEYGIPLSLQGKKMNVFIGMNAGF